MISALVDEKLYGRLLAQARPAVVESEREHKKLLDQIEDLMEIGDQRTAEQDRLLRLLARLAEDYETQNHQVPDASPAAVLAYLLQKRGMKQSELAAVLGCSRSVVSDMIAGRRLVSRTNALRMAAYFRLQAEVFLRP